MLGYIRHIALFRDLPTHQFFHRLQNGKEWPDSFYHEDINVYRGGGGGP